MTIIPSRVARVFRTILILSLKTWPCGRLMFPISGQVLEEPGSTGPFLRAYMELDGETPHRSS